MANARWGVIATIRAAREDVLAFAAWHLELGAHRLYIYLDAPAPETETTLAAHPKIRVIQTDDAWWQKRGGRPDKHQVRQSKNARHANNRRIEVDWLCHIDVDEFLMPIDGRVGAQLAALPPEVQTVRMRPVEALAAPGGFAPHGETAFKAFHLDAAARQAASERCFPTWGRYLSGGFLSHVAGKLFFRTGLNGLQIKIHNVVHNDVQNPGAIELPGIELAHLHAKSWEAWLAAYRFRLERGSYRDELRPQVRSGGDLPNLHRLFAAIEAEGGLDALRAFYEEVCVATPALCARLDAEGLLRRHDLELDLLTQKHFPHSG